MKVEIIDGTETATINVASEFSELPFGRYPKHGPNNGQRFREETLLPALAAHKKVIVDLAGTRGLGPSFLEESFGGLVRAGYRETELRERLHITNPDYSYVVDSWSYVADEDRKVNSTKPVDKVD